MDNEMRVETPLGAIMVRTTGDPEHPGVWIDLRRRDADCDLTLCLVEFSVDDADYAEGEPHIITRVWNDARNTDYTDRIVHEGIEEYFREE